MDFTEALKILRKDEEEDRNWRSARQKLTELLQVAEEAKRTLDKFQQQKEHLEASISHLTTQEANLHRAVTGLKAEVDGYKDKLRVNMQEEERTLAGVRAAREAEEGKLGEARGQFEELKSRFS